MGKNVPETLPLKSLAGATSTLGEHKGKVLIITFWDSACDSCMKELKSLYQLHRVTDEKDLEVLTMNGDRIKYNALKALDTYAHEVYLPDFAIGEEWDFLYDGDELKTAKAYPITLVLDRSLKIVHVLSGEHDWVGAFGKDLVASVLDPSKPAPKAAPALPGAFLKVGMKAPDDLPLLEPGGKRGTLADFKGRPVLIDYWASWCTYCLAELPSLVQLRKFYSDRHLAVVLMNSDLDWTQGKMALDERVGKIDLPIYLGHGSAWETEFDIEGLPFTVVLDENHVILYAESGKRDWLGPFGLEVFRPLQRH